MKIWKQKRNEPSKLLTEIMDGGVSKYDLLVIKTRSNEKMCIL